MKVATWNVNGIRAREAQFCEWVERDRPDVVCLQELKAQPDQIPVRCAHADYHVYWHGMRAYSGVSLHVSKALQADPPQFTHPTLDMESRIVQATLGDLVQWAEQLSADGRDVVICGDLNVAHTDIDVHPRERKAGVIGQRPEERDLFDRLLGTHFVDVARALSPDDDAMFTWWPPWRNMRQRNIGWRIDYILASKSIAQRVERCDVLADIGTSDHAPVMMTVGSAQQT